jgi:hypothetical protein
MGYPKMIYRGGTDLADHRTVADEAAEKAAEADGYLPLDMPAFMAAKAKGTAPAKAEAKAKGTAPAKAEAKAKGSDLV